MILRSYTTYDLRLFRPGHKGEGGTASALVIVYRVYH